MTTHSVDIPFDITEGTHSNTEIFEGKLRLKKTGVANNGQDDVFANEGYWVSDVIDLVGKYTSLENLAITSIINGDSYYKAYTRTSDNNVDWDDFIEINNQSGKMMSAPKRYIQIKINFFGSVDDVTETYNNFTSEESEFFTENNFVNFNGALQLKRDYQYDMVKDGGWNNEGVLLRKTIEKSKFKKIDSLKHIYTGE